MQNVERLEKSMGVSFKDKLLLQEALTHRSYLNEHPSWPTPHNERLEFLGDAVLEIVVTKFLFEKYPTADEGRLTSIRAALVNHRMLSRVAKELKLENFIFLSKGEQAGSTRAKKAIMANAVEAIIGSIYLDRGIDVVTEFIRNKVLIHLDVVMEEELYSDPKSTLQEVAQEKFQLTPHYKVLEESGPDHKKTFIVGVFFDSDLKARGRGSSKQEAESEAAEKALHDLV